MARAAAAAASPRRRRRQPAAAAVLALLLLALLACTHAILAVHAEEEGPVGEATAAAAAAAGEDADDDDDAEYDYRPMTDEEMEAELGPMTPRMKELLRQVQEQMIQVKRENPGAHIQFINPDDLKVTPIYKPAKCVAAAKTGDIVTLHMVGVATNGGKTFIDTRNNGSSNGGSGKEEGEGEGTGKGKGQPWVVELGAGQLPTMGLDTALLGMCIGESAAVELPSHLAYGEAGSPPLVPPASGVTIEVEILAINHNDGTEDDDEYDDGGGSDADAGDAAEGGPAGDKKQKEAAAGAAAAGSAPRDEL